MPNTRTRVGVAFDAQMLTRTRLHRDRHPLGPEALAAVGDAAPVAKALSAAGHRVTLLPLDHRAGAQLSQVTPRRFDVVFNLCDTLGGHSRLAPLVPTLLEAQGVPVVGADQFGLAISKRKHDVKALLVRDGVPTPKYAVISSLTEVKRFASARHGLTLPAILKLTAEHSSIGIESTSVVFTDAELKRRATLLLKRFDQPVLIEEYVAGREFYVSFAGPDATPLPMMEHAFDDLPEGFLPIRTFDMKWFNDPALGGERPRRDPRWARPVPHRHPPAPWRGALEDIAALCRTAFLAVGGRDWGRVDFRIDRGGVPMLIDVTPNTYLGPSAPCVAAAQRAGLEYAALVNLILEGALARHRR